MVVSNWSPKNLQELAVVGYSRLYFLMAVVRELELVLVLVLLVLGAVVAALDVAVLVHVLEVW